MTLKHSHSYCVHTIALTQAYAYRAHAALDAHAIALHKRLEISMPTTLYATPAKHISAMFITYPQTT